MLCWCCSARGQGMAFSMNSTLSTGAQVPNGLVGWWTLDEGAGTATTDFSGNGYTGTLVLVPKWTNGIIQNAIGFTVTNYVNVGGVTNSITNSTQGSISFWMTLNDPITESVPFSISRNANATQTEWFWDCDTRAGNKWFDSALRMDGTTKWQGHTAINSLLSYTNGFTHFVITHNGTTPTYYLNGVSLTITFTITTDKTPWFKGILTTATSKADSVSIGTLRRNNALVVPFNRTVDDVRIYNRALSAAEVAILYNNRAGVK